MKRNKDFTSDAVKESIEKTMAKIQAYVGKNWAQGKECKVIKHVQELLDAEIDKYLASGTASAVYFRLANSKDARKKYDECYSKNLEKYGPYIMELLVEYSNTLSLSGRYDVGDRYDEVNDEIMDSLQKDFLSKKSITEILERVEEDIAKFMKQHGVEDYTLTIGSIAEAINVNGDMILEKKDAPRGTLRFEFAKVSGDFICSDCGLTSLLFGPKEVGGNFDCSGNKLSKYALSEAPKVVGGDFIWRDNEDQVSYSEIRKRVQVKGKVITDAPMTPEEKEAFRQDVIREQNEFLAKYRAVGKKMEKAINDGDIKTVEACREFFYDAIDFFKDRPWITAQGMKISYQILMKAYVSLKQMAPEKYPSIGDEEVKLTKLTDRLTYPDGYNWL